MSGRTLLALLIACVAVGGAILLFELKGEETEPGSDLIGLPPSGVEGLTIINAEDTVTAGKVGSNWFVLSPIRDLADTRTIENLLTELQSVRGKRSFETEGNLASFGLEPPVLELYVADSSWATLSKIAIGDLNPTGSFRYAKIGDSTTVHLVDADSFQRLGKTVDDLRSRALLESAREDLDRITCHVREWTLELARTDIGWAMVMPVKALADANEISSFLSRLQDPVIGEFRHQRIRGIEEPAAIWIFDSLYGTHAETLWVGEPSDEGFIVQSSNRAFDLMVQTDLSTPLLAEPDHWRSKQLLGFSSYKVNKLTIDKPGSEPLAFHETDDGAWYIGDWKADSDKIMEIVRAAEDCRVHQFLDDSVDTVWNEELELRLVSADNDSVAVRIGPRQEDSRVVHSSHLGGPALSDCFDPDSVAMDPLHWRERDLVSFSPYQIEKVRVKWGSLEAQAEKEGFLDWKLSGPWTEASSIDSLLETLEQARVILFPEQMESQQEQTEEASITLELEDTPILTIHLYSLSADTVGARIGDGEMCTIGIELLDHVREVLTTTEQ